MATTDYNGIFNQQMQNSALAQQQQGLGGLAGGLLGQQRMNQEYRDPLRELLANAEPPRPKTIREELQLETDEWLKDTI